MEATLAVCKLIMRRYNSFVYQMTYIFLNFNCLSIRMAHKNSIALASKLKDRSKNAGWMLKLFCRTAFELGNHHEMSRSPNR